MSSRAARPRSRRRLVGVSAVAVGALLTTYAGALRSVTYARAVTPAAASCSPGATLVADDTELQAAIASSVDDSVICITADITLTATLAIDDTTITLEGRNVGGRNPELSGENSGRVIKAYFTDNASDDTLTIRDLDLVKGRAPGPSGQGGALLVVGGNRSDALVIADSEIAENDSPGDGGGVSARNLASVYVSNSLFRNNRIVDTTAGDIVGGALKVRNTEQTTITGSDFRDNSSLEWGGAVFLNDSGITRIIGSTFERNSSGTDAGGAIEVDIDDSTLPGALYVSSTVFRDNSSTSGAGGAVRVGDNDDTVSFSSVTFDGNSTGSNSGGGLNISSQSGPVFLSDITAIDNSAGSSGGFLRLSGTSPTVLIERLDSQRNSANSDGGSIKQSAGSLEVRDSTFADDSAFDGGAIYSENLSLARVSNSNFIGNYAGDDGGGLMVRNSISAYITGTNFENNVAGSDGGGIHIRNAFTHVLDSVEFTRNSAGGDGGAMGIYSSNGVDDSTLLTNVTFADDSAGGRGGAVYGRLEGYLGLYGVSSSGTRSVNDGGFAYVAWDDSTLATARMRASSLMITDSRATASNADGGAIYLKEFYSLYMNRSSIRQSHAGDDGGALMAINLTSAEILESSFIGNSAGEATGGLDLTAVRNSVLLSGNTLAGNVAGDYAGGSYLGLDGGAVARVVNSTFSGNSANANGSYGGGGLYVFGRSTPTAAVAVEFSTLTSNSAKEGGGIQLGGSALMAISNSIISGNSSATMGADINVDDTATLDDSFSLFSSADAVSGATIDGPGSLFGAPKLNGLADNGGPTLTMLPQWDSPAFQAGDPNWSAPPANDQRGTGFPRDAGGRVSMGAIQGRSAKPIDPVFPPSAPREVQAVAGDEQALVTWMAPASTGSFPVTTYQVDDSTGEISVLVPVTPGEPLSTVIQDLGNGREYAFRVRALNGAGWGTWSDYSDTVIPQPGPSILISGTRDGRFARVQGETTGLVGQSMIPRVRLPGPHPYKDGVARPVVDDAGEFTWQRQGGKKVYVYFFTEDLQLRSNRVIIPAQR